MTFMMKTYKPIVESGVNSGNPIYGMVQTHGRGTGKFFLKIG
jgi:hypothetical protein